MGRFHSKTLRMFSHPHITELIQHRRFPRSLVEIVSGVSHDNYVLIFFSFSAKVFSWGGVVYEKAVQGKKNFFRDHMKQLFAVYQNLQGIMK